MLRFTDWYGDVLLVKHDTNMDLVYIIVPKTDTQTVELARKDVIALRNRLDILIDKMGVEGDTTFDAGVWSDDE